MKKSLQIASIMLSFPILSFAQEDKKDSVATLKEQTLQNVVITSKRTKQTNAGAINGQTLYRGELFKAACCNLGESFVNNPSVDVNYSDATTGAKQVKLLGLSGKYVQMLTENLPNFRGVAMPYSLSYVPGSWMKSLQVSKGNASVKNGYEALTGQINVEYLQPEDNQGLGVNLYGNSMNRFEANIDGNIHINGNKNISTEILSHFENNWDKHDGNHDGFQDDPQVRQYNLQNRWYIKQKDYIFHGGLAFLKEDRTGGQTHHSNLIDPQRGAYKTNIGTERYEAYLKNAFILNAEHGTNIALMGNFSLQEQDALYGFKHYNVNEKNAYGSLMFETNITKEHNISAGLSINHDYFKQNTWLNGLADDEQWGNIYNLKNNIEQETTSGIYAQYTYNLRNKLIAMAGLRVDNSSLYGTFLTPRFHLKWVANNVLTLRLSAGKGYRTPFALAENNYLMASGRRFIVDKLNQEKAWNYGITAGLFIPLAQKTLRVNAEYYYTHFLSQAIIDYDTDPLALHITNLEGKSLSHTFQVDASYPLFRGLELTAAYRYNFVKETYHGVLMRKPLQNFYKALFTASYKTPLELWQFDLTFALNGGGRMPSSYTLSNGDNAWKSTFKAYPTLNAQITRNIKHGSLYVGAENITGYKQKNAIIGYDNPWSNTFDPTMIYAPMRGAMVYVGLRYNLGNRN